MKKTKRQFGRVFRPDKRDARYRLAAKKSQRTSRYWNGGEILDQGATPQCVAFAWAGWLLAPPISGQWLNPAGIYEIAQHFDEWEGEAYEGTSVRAGAKVLKSLGFVSEYRWATTVDAIVYAVLEVSPVVVGTDWFAGMDQPDGDGWLWDTGDVLGGHAYVLDGYSVKTHLFRMRNSWGDGWEENGRAWMPEPVVDRLLKRDGEACLAIEAKPRKAA